MLLENPCTVGYSEISMNNIILYVKLKDRMIRVI